MKFLLCPRFCNKAALLCVNFRFVSVVRTFVFGQNCPPWKHFLANFTLVRLFSRVGTAVYHNVTAIREFFATHFTFKRFLTCMNADVRCKWTTLRKGFGTYVTDIRFFSSVDTLVSHKISIFQELFAAKFTPEWFLPCMYKEVRL